MVGKDQAPIVIMAYVDDLLVATTSESALKTLMTALSAHVKVRETGRVGLKGGHLRFLGRSIFRRPGSSALYMQVDPTYLDEAFAEFDLKKGSTTFPDLRPILEQEGSQPLSAEGHARFRRVLGRLSWYCQTRQDLLILVSMLGTGQAQPFETHERCLLAVLRYLMTDMDVACVFHQKSLLCPMWKVWKCTQMLGLHLWRVLDVVLFQVLVSSFNSVLMKCFSRHQSAVTLSSCEAELVALQSGVQEGIGLLRTLGFVLGRLYPWVDIIPQDAQVTWYDEAESDDEDSMKVSYLFPLVVKTDSLSGKMLLEASDLQRKSRHIEIKVYWLRELMDRKVLLLSHVPGTLNPADCFTKCLPLRSFYFTGTCLDLWKLISVWFRTSLVFAWKVCDNSYSKPISCLSNRNCVLCGERLLLFALKEELEVSGDQRSFRHVKAVFAQESLTNPDSLPLVVALMAEEDTRSSVSGFTRVDWTTGEPREDPTGGVMRRDAVVEEVVEASSGEPMATKRRQKAKWEEIKKTAKEERAQPAPVFEIPARGGDVPVRSFFRPYFRQKRVDREQKFRATQSGFSRYPTENRTCHQCGEKGHLSANCPQKVRRVSLTEGVIKYEGAGETRPRVRLQEIWGSAQRIQHLRWVDSTWDDEFGGDYEEVAAASATTSNERESKDCQEQTRCSAVDFCDICTYASTTTTKAPG